jgi:hypothetical protein
MDRRHVPPVFANRTGRRSDGSVDLNFHVPAHCEIAVTAVAANAGHHFLVLVG